MDDIQKLIKSLEQEIKETTTDILKEDMLLRLQEVARTYNGKDRIVSSLEISEDIKNKPPEKKILSGIIGLDNILDGFRLGQLIILSGITKHGKTSMAVELTIRLKEENPLWFPFEEPASELILKFHERNQEPPLFYTPLTLMNSTLLWIEKKIIEAKVKHNAQIVFIDHLHFLTKPSQNLTQEIGALVREIKKLAIKWKVVIFLLAHLRKTQLDKNPDLEDLKDSSSIAQEADTTLFIWRETIKENGEIQITNNTNLSVQANRKTGKTGNVKLVYTNGRFLEQDWKHKETINDFQF